MQTPGEAPTYAVHGAREEQPCWCPDAHIASACFVPHCPQHGARPDPTLWDYSAGTWYAAGDHYADAPDGAVIEWPDFGPGLWERQGDRWLQHVEPVR